MTGALYVPGAITSGPYWFQGKVSPGLAQSRISKLVLHSTETPGSGGCPGYKGGTEAPTITANPWTKVAWQHFPANVSAKALADPASTPVRENRDEVAQIEVIGYSSKALSDRYGYAISEIPEDGLAWLAEIVRFYHEEWQVPYVLAPRWASYEALAPGALSVRMSSDEYDRFEGILGHQHVPGNTHLDPGNLNVTRLVDLAQYGGPTGGGITPPKQEGFLMALDDKQQSDVYWRTQKGIPEGDASGRKVNGQPTRVLDTGDGQTLRNDIAGVKGALVGITAAIEALAKGSGLTAQEITDAAYAGTVKALEDHGGAESTS